MDKILISPSSFGECSGEPISMLKEAGLEVVLNPYKRRLTSDEVLVLAKDCIGIIAGVENLDGNTLSRLRNLRVISRVGVGLENIDLKAADELGIIIKNTPQAPAQAVAELTVGLILNLLRHISLQDRLIHNKRWEKKMGCLLSGKTIGIIGIGRIGKKVAQLLKGMAAKIVVYDLKPDRNWAAKHKIKILPFNDLLSINDIITIHVSSGNTLLGSEEIKMMKKGAYLVNVSRGEVVEENALYNALKSGWLSGAALDVFSDEPYSGPLAELDNVILTPHIGSYARESRIKMECEAARNLLAALKIKKGEN